MSLEALITENTKAMVNLTDALNKSNELAERTISLKSEAIETVKATAAKPAAENKKADKSTATEKAAEAPKTEEKASEPEAPMADPVADAIKSYVGTGYDAAHPQAADERKARSAKVKEIFAVIAQKAGKEVKNHADIPEAMHGAFLKTIAKRAEEGNLVIGKTAEGEEEDLMG